MQHESRVPVRCYDQPLGLPGSLSLTEEALLPAPAAYFNVDGDSLELSTKAK